jgi:hypothetical protein
MHSRVRADPPMSWLASTRQTDQPASASRTAAASLFGPPPATIASTSTTVASLPIRRQHKQASSRQTMTR